MIIKQTRQTIISVALINPKKDLFISEIKYLLFVATPIEVIVFAVLFEGNNIHGEMRLQTSKSSFFFSFEFNFTKLIKKADLSVTSDDVNFSCIAGTLNGRVFMGGGDGNLYEFEYEEKSSWLFNKKCRKRNHTQTTLDMFIPSFLSWSGVDPIVRIAIDETRNFLYTLSEKSSITLYNLGSGKTLSKVSTLSNIANNPMVKKIGVISEQFQIIYIAPITSYESNMIHLIGVTRLGRRIYFSVKRNNVMASSIDVLEAKDLIDSIPRNVHRAFYRDGILLMSSYFSENEDDLIYIRVEASKLENEIEDMNQIKINSKVFAISEHAQAGSLNLLVDNFADNQSDQVTKELISQYYKPKRVFLCLTYQGMEFFENLRPRDKLELILNKTNGRVDSRELEIFFKYYGHEESCMMCLLLCCSPNTVNNVSDWAARIFLLKGSEIILVKQEKSFKYSSICLYVSRLLRNLWELILCTIDSSLEKDLKEIFIQLSSLSNFMKSNNLLPQNPQNFMSNTVYSNEDILISRVHLLITRCSEALQLLLILIRDPLLSKFLPEIDKYSETSPTNFFFLATQPVGSKLVLNLIPEMISLLPSIQEKKLLNEKLENSCPNLYNKILKEKYHANQILESTNELTGTQFLHKNLLSSLDIYIRLAPHLSLTETKFVLQKYDSLKFFDGFVKLALIIASYKNNEEVFVIYKLVFELLEKVYLENLFTHKLLIYLNYYFIKNYFYSYFNF